jgi:hypothetical protein
MGNLAQRKLPLEQDVWVNPQEATDGNYTKYDGYSGWAYAKWPANFTLDFEKNQPIRQIRLLLYDGLGHSNQVDKRKYQFEIRLSEDGENFFTFFSNRSGGGNGWFIIDFVNEVNARFVQFVGLHNDANESIHLVEMEVFDDPPTSFANSPNIHKAIAGGTLPNSKYFENLARQAFKDVGVNLQEILEERERVREAANKIIENADLKTLIQRFAAYAEAIQEGKDNLKTWARISAGISILLVLLLLYFMYCDTSTVTYLCDVIAKFGDLETSKSFGGAQAFLHYRMGLYLISRFVLLSILLFLLSWSLRNYRAERHNILINQHKAMSIATAVQLNGDESLKDTPKGEIILEAIRTVFSHQATGYDKSDSSDNAGVNVVNNIKEIVK